MSGALKQGGADLHLLKLRAFLGVQKNQSSDQTSTT